jgi:hypothetical protein
VPVVHEAYHASTRMESRTTTKPELPGAGSGRRAFCRAVAISGMGWKDVRALAIARGGTAKSTRRRSAKMSRGFEPLQSGRRGSGIKAAVGRLDH